MTKNNEIRYPFNSQIMFAKIMQHQHVSKEFLQRLFSNRKIADVKVREIATVTTEATVIPGVYSKSVRLDVLFDDDESWYNIEMQVAREEDLPQRGRYYSAAIDVAHLEKGRPYGDLKQSFVIFLCRFDYYNQGEAVYAFERIDKRLQLPCGDGSYIIILNTKCAQEKVPQELQGLFHYINTEEVDEGDWFVEMIHQMVLRYQSDEEVANMATLEDEYLRKNTLAERKGRAEGEDRVNKLNKLLVEIGRTDDLQKSIVDSEYQKTLFKEFGL